MLIQLSFKLSPPIRMPPLNHSFFSRLFYPKSLPIYFSSVTNQGGYTQGFPIMALLTFGTGQFFVVRGCPVPFGMSSNISVFYPLGTSSILLILRHFTMFLLGPSCPWLRTCGLYFILHHYRLAYSEIKLACFEHCLVCKSCPTLLKPHGL